MWRKNPPYTIVFSHKAANGLDRLERSQPKTHRRILEAIDTLAFTQQYAPIKSLTSEFKGLFRIRVRGKYRIIFEFDHNVGKLYIVRVDDREDVYRP